jgi:hypothetical protein
VRKVGISLMLLPLLLMLSWCTVADKRSGYGTLRVLLLPTLLTPRRLTSTFPWCTPPPPPFSFNWACFCKKQKRCVKCSSKYSILGSTPFISKLGVTQSVQRLDYKRGSVSARGWEFLFPSSRPDRIWGPPSLLSNGGRKIFPRG